MKNFGEKEAWAYPGTAHFFGVPPIISATAAATKFNLGRYIHRVHVNTSPLNIWGTRQSRRIQELSKFYEYPLLSQERIKLGTSNLAGIFTGSIQIKAL